VTIASVCLLPKVLMWRIASATPGRVEMDRIGARYSVVQSSSVASFTPTTPAASRIARDSGQQRNSTPLPW
jgi:hypothetical protein